MDFRRLSPAKTKTPGGTANLEKVREVEQQMQEVVPENLYRDHAPFDVQQRSNPRKDGLAENLCARQIHRDNASQQSFFPSYGTEAGQFQEAGTARWSGAPAHLRRRTSPTNTSKFTQFEGRPFQFMRDLLWNGEMTHRGSGPFFFQIGTKSRGGAALRRRGLAPTQGLRRRATANARTEPDHAAVSD